MKRETIYWLAYGAIALLSVTGPAPSKNPPTSPAKGSGRGSGGANRPPSKTPQTGGGKGGDVISYLVDSASGRIYVKTQEAPDVEWGAPELAASKVPAFQAMLKNYGSLVDEIGANLRIPSKEIWAIMWSESGGNAHAVSKVGAQGLMQVMPFHFPKGITVLQMQDPRTNIQTGVQIMAQRRQGGARDIVQMASLYNAGGNADGNPFTNAQKPSLATRWGYASEPGYIDSVVAAYNTGAKLGINA
jgi:Transglycosylase SLT domain